MKAAGPMREIKRRLRVLEVAQIERDAPVVSLSSIPWGEVMEGLPIDLMWRLKLVGGAWVDKLDEYSA